MEKRPHSHSLDDDIESLFYSTVDILCGNNITWNKGINLEDILAHKVYIMHHHFNKQLKYALSQSYADILRTFHSLLFVDNKRAEVNIDQVITFLSNQIEALTDPVGSVELEDPTTTE